jgi:hypothetical protein
MEAPMPALGSNLLRFEDNSSSSNLPGVPQAGTGPDGLADWYYRNMRDAAAYQAYLTHAFISNCYRNRASIDGGQVVHDAAASELKGAARSAGVGFFTGGPDGALAGGVRGALLGPLRGAAKSVLRQACFR